MGEQLLHDKTAAKACVVDEADEAITRCPTAETLPHYEQFFGCGEHRGDWSTSGQDGAAHPTDPGARAPRSLVPTSEPAVFASECFTTEEPSCRAPKVVVSRRRLPSVWKLTRQLEERKMLKEQRDATGFFKGVMFRGIHSSEVACKTTADPSKSTSHVGTVGVALATWAGAAALALRKRKQQ